MPISLFPKQHRDALTRFDFTHSVASLESIGEQARAAGRTAIRSEFPVEIYANITVLPGYGTMRMWLEVPISSVVGVLDEVRSRALTFVLEIEQENPQAGNASLVEGTREPPIPIARANAIFSTVIYGGQVTVGPNPLVSLGVTAGDIESLMRYLEEAGVAHEDRAELEEAIAADDASGRPSDAPGKWVSDWLGRNSIKLAAPGGRIGEGAAGSLVAAAVARFLGLI